MDDKTESEIVDVISEIHPEYFNKYVGALVVAVILANFILTVLIFARG